MRFCDIQNNKVKETLSATLIIRDITETESNNYFTVHSFEENNDQHTIDIALGNHALRAEPTD